MEFSKETVEKTKLAGIERTENNVITNINGVDVNEMNKIAQEKEMQEEKLKAKFHTSDEDETNYIALFTILGLGVGMVFGKFIFKTIILAMCAGTILGLVVGIIFTKYMRKKTTGNKGE